MQRRAGQDRSGKQARVPPGGGGSGGGGGGTRLVRRKPEAWAAQLTLNTSAEYQAACWSAAAGRSRLSSGLAVEEAARAPAQAGRALQGAPWRPRVRSMALAGRGLGWGGGVLEGCLPGPGDWFNGQQEIV